MGKRLPGNGLCGQLSYYQSQRRDCNQHFYTWIPGLGCGGLCDSSSGMLPLWLLTLKLLIGSFPFTDFALLINDWQSSNITDAQTDRFSPRKQCRQIRFLLRV